MSGQVLPNLLVFFFFLAKQSHSKIYAQNKLDTTLKTTTLRATEVEKKKLCGQVAEGKSTVWVSWLFGLG